MIKIHKDNDTYQFSLRTESGNTLLNSIAFPDKFEMDKVLRKLESMLLTRNHFERKTNTDGRFLFTLMDDDGLTIGRSGPYDSEAGMQNGIKNLQEQIKKSL